MHSRKSCSHSGKRGERPANGFNDAVTNPIIARSFQILCLLRFLAAPDSTSKARTRLDPFGDFGFALHGSDRIMVLTDRIR